MAEYTIPKPYRDFYVTDPYVGLQKEIEDLHKCSDLFSEVEYGSVLHGKNTLPDKEIPVKVESKNLIIYPYTTSEKTVNGVTFSVQSDGGILCSGTPTDNASMTIQTINVSKDTIYTFSASGTHSNISCYADVYDSSNNHINTFFANSGIIDLSSYADVSKMIIGIAISSIDTEVSGTIYPQVEKGDTATSYALYQPEGTPVTVTTCGKNLLNVPSALDITLISFPVNLQKGKTYTISCSSVVKGGENDVNVNFYNLNKGYISGTNLILTNDSVHTLHFNEDVGHITLYSNGLSTADSRNTTSTIMNLMIQEGYKKTPYEPYTEKTVQTEIGETITCNQLDDNTNIFSDNKGVTLSTRFVLSNEKTFQDKPTVIVGTLANRPTDITDYPRIYIATDKSDTNRTTYLPAGKIGSLASNWIYM